MLSKDIPPVHKWPKFEQLVDAILRAPVLSDQEIEAASNYKLYNIKTGQINRELTRTEKRDLRLIASGLNARQVALARGVTEYAVDRNLRKARFKLEADSTVQAVAIATRRGLI